MKQSHILISGYVQGVGFRRFVQKEANKLKLSGWVRNLQDRRVEVLVQGERSKIDKLIKKCERGPMLAQVKSIAHKVEEADSLLEGFEMLETAELG
jgi:acylphosphatase